MTVVEGTGTGEEEEEGSGGELENQAREGLATRQDCFAAVCTVLPQETEPPGERRGALLDALAEKHCSLGFRHPR